MPSSHSIGGQFRVNISHSTNYSCECAIYSCRSATSSGLCHLGSLCSQAGLHRHTIGRQRSLVVSARLGSPKKGAGVVKSQKDLRRERREQLDDGNIWDALVDANSRLTNEGVDIKNLLVTGLVLGLTFGTAFQPTHNNGYLPVSSLLQIAQCLA